MGIAVDVASVIRSQSRDGVLLYGPSHAPQMVCLTVRIGSVGKRPWGKIQSGSFYVTEEPFHVSSYLYTIEKGALKQRKTDWPRTTLQTKGNLGNPNSITVSKTLS